MGTFAIPIAMAAMSAASSFMQSNARQQQAQAQASALEQQADLTRRQADYAQQKGDIEARSIERRKSEIRRKFEALMGKNRANLAAGNVDMTSGSSIDIAMGNINRFADDVGENAYEAALKRWETEEQTKMMRYQADMYDANADATSRAGGNLLGSLLGAGMAGMGSFIQGGMLTGAFTSAPSQIPTAVQNTSLAVSRYNTSQSAMAHSGLFSSMGNRIYLGFK